MGKVYIIQPSYWWNQSILLIIKDIFLLDGTSAHRCFVHNVLQFFYLATSEKHHILYNGKQTQRHLSMTKAGALDGGFPYRIYKFPSRMSFDISVYVIVA